MVNISESYIKDISNVCKSYVINIYCNKYIFVLNINIHYFLKEQAYFTFPIEHLFTFSFPK